MSIKKVVRIFQSMVFVCLTSVSEAQIVNAAPPAYSIPYTEVHSIKSDILRREYELYIKLPSSYSKSNHKYPVVFVNDATFSFPIGSSLTRLLIGQNNIRELIIVGVSYGKGESPQLSRTRDYTPSHVDNCCHGREFQQFSGQAKNYAGFLAKEVIPFIDKHYRTAPAERTLVGYSFSGLFGAYMLIEHPEVFENYILVSPSLWYDKGIIFKLEANRYQFNKNFSKKVFLAVGELEQPNKSGTHNDLVNDLTKFHKQLSNRRYSKLESKLRIVDDEIHNTVFPSALASGLLWLFPE